MREAVTTQTAVSGIDGRGPIPLRRDVTASNQYIHQHSMIYGAFPTVFPLGQGLSNIVNAQQEHQESGPLDLEVRTHLVHHFSQPLHNQRLLFYLHNVKYRADCGRAAASMVRTDSTRLSNFFHICMSPDFNARMEFALENPNSQEARQLVCDLSPAIVATSSHIPFSPLERGGRCANELISLVRFCGLPNVFLTIGPDERRMAIIARLVYSNDNGPNGNYCRNGNTGVGASARSFWAGPNAASDSSQANPASSFADFAQQLPNMIPNLEEGEVIWRQEVGTLITNNPAAVTVMCQRMMEAVDECLIGLPRTTRRSRIPGYSQPTGVLGRARAIFWVSENQGRKQLHWHGLIWAGLPQWLPQRAAGHDLGRVIADILSSVFSASAPPNIHAINLLRRQANQNQNPAFFSPPTPNTSAADIRLCGQAANVAISGHSHCETCKKGEKGRNECRLAYGRPYATNTLPRALTTTAVTNGDQGPAIVIHALVPVQPYTPVAAHTESYSDQNSFANLHMRLGNLATPGHDRRLIEYPLLRPRLHVTLPDTIPQPDALINQLYVRLFNRLEVVRIKLNLPPLPGLGRQPSEESTSRLPQSVDPTTLAPDVLADAIGNFMAHVGLGDPVVESAILDDPVILDALLAAWPVGDSIVNILDYFSHQNSLLGETNLPMAAALGCNVNAQPLVGTEAAMNAIFYLIDYACKDTLIPAELLSFVQAARRRFNQYDGQAPNGEDPNVGDRPWRRLQQIVQNGIAGTAEYSAQQCALNVAGYPAHWCSERFSYVFGTPALRHFRSCYHNARAEPVDEWVEETVNRGLGPHTSSDVRGQDIASDINRFSTIVDSSAITSSDSRSLSSGPAPAVGTVHRRREDDQLVVLSQDIDYINRGQHLSFFSITEYGCIVRRVESTLQRAARARQPTAASDNTVISGPTTTNTSSSTMHDTTQTCTIHAVSRFLNLDSDEDEQSLRPSVSSHRCTCAARSAENSDNVPDNTFMSSADDPISGTATRTAPTSSRTTTGPHRQVGRPTSTVFAYEEAYPIPDQVHIYIYIYMMCMCVCVCVNIYIYIHVYI